MAPWARETSPGRTHALPPPISETLEAPWWGARNGGEVTRASPGRGPPGGGVDAGGGEGLEGRVGGDE